MSDLTGIPRIGRGRKLNPDKITKKQSPLRPSPVPSTSMQSPPRSPPRLPIESYENYPESPSDLNLTPDEEIEEAIKLSLENNTKNVIDDTDFAYELSLNIDKEKRRKKEEEEARIKKEQYKQEMIQHVINKRERDLRELRSPPKIRPVTGTGGAGEVLTLKIKIPEKGKEFTYRINKNESLKTLINKVKFEGQHIGDVKLSIPGLKGFTCDPESDLETCGIKNYSVVIADIIALPDIYIPYLTSPIHTPKGRIDKISVDKKGSPKNIVKRKKPQPYFDPDEYPTNQLVVIKVRNIGVKEVQYVFHHKEFYGTLLDSISYDFNVDNFKINYPGGRGLLSCDRTDTLEDCHINNKSLLTLYFP